MKTKHVLQGAALGIVLLLGTGCEARSDEGSGNEIREQAARARSYYEEELLVAPDAGTIQRAR